VKTDARDAILKSASLVLRPIVSLLMRYGIGLNDVIEVIKRLYVEVAQQTLLADQRKATESAISVMSGVHRKDVHRIVEDPSFAAPTMAFEREGALDRAMQLWTNDSRFLSKSGAPRPLARRTVAQPTRARYTTFDDLIEAVSKGVPPRSVLDQWLRLGAVTLNTNAEVVFAKPEFAKGQELSQIMRSMVASADRLTAAVNNIFAGELRYALGYVRGYDLTEAQVEKLDAKVRLIVRATSEKLNALVVQAEERSAREPESPQGRFRYSMGLHAYYEPCNLLRKRGFEDH
jgi:hypothetical protein